MLEELCDVDIRILKSTLECAAVDFIMKGKYDASAVRMFHIDVAALAKYLSEAKALEGSKHFPCRRAVVTS